MGYEAIFRCRQCGREFKSRVGGGVHFRLLRCVNCDRLVEVETESTGREPPPQVTSCPRCGGKLRDDLMPMCRRCRARDVEVVRTLILYD